MFLSEIVRATARSVAPVAHRPILILPNSLIDRPAERHYEREAIITLIILSGRVVKDKQGRYFTAEDTAPLIIGGTMGVQQHISPGAPNADTGRKDVPLVITRKNDSTLAPKITWEGVDRALSHMN